MSVASLQTERKQARTINRATITRSTPVEDLPEYLTAKEVAAKLGISLFTVYARMKSGEVPTRSFGPRLNFIPRSYLQQQA